jgi:hypothetical protein
MLRLHDSSKSSVTELKHIEMVKMPEKAFKSTDFYVISDL